MGQTPQEAEGVINFLDQLRHEIGTVYGQEMHQEIDQNDRMPDDWNDQVLF